MTAQRSNYPKLALMVLLLLLIAAPGVPPFAAPAGPAPEAAEILSILREARAERLRKRNRARERKALAAFLLAGGAKTIVPHSCMDHSGINPLYLLPHYYRSFVRNQSQPPETLIIGDSTAAISAHVPGFLTPRLSGSIAVPGNRLCHMLITHAKSAGGAQPKVVIVMTLGGNDLLAGHARATILKDTAALRNDLRGRYPKAKLVGVAVHPVRLGAARNSIIGALNEETRRVWLEDEAACFVDPGSLFTRDQTGQPTEDLFLPGDSIHYGSAIALKLSRLIRETCAVAL